MLLRSPSSLPVQQQHAQYGSNGMQEIHKAGSGADTSDGYRTVIGIAYGDCLVVQLRKHVCCFHPETPATNGIINHNPSICCIGTVESVICTLDLVFETPPLTPLQQQ